MEENRDEDLIKRELGGGARFARLEEETEM